PPLLTRRGLLPLTTKCLNSSARSQTAPTTTRQKIFAASEEEEIRLSCRAKYGYFCACSFWIKAEVVGCGTLEAPSKPTTPAKPLAASSGVSPCRSLTSSRAPCAARN